MRAEQERLEPGDRRVARRQVRDRLDPAGALDRDRGHDAAHPRAGARVVVDVDEVRLARLAQGMARLDQRAVVRAERRVELDRDDELLLAEHPRELGLLRRGLRGVGELALADDERRGRGAILVDRGADRRDLRRRRAAAAADDAGAEPARLRRELGEVVRASRAGRRRGCRRGSRGRRSGARRARARRAASRRARSAPPPGRRCGSRPAAATSSSRAARPRSRPRRRRASGRRRRRSSARRPGATRRRARPRSRRRARRGRRTSRA